jgi:outer membrane protein assembly factor BamB
MRRNWTAPGLIAALLGSYLTLAGEEPRKAETASWTHWRGPSGQGYSDDKRVPLKWGEKENLLWKTELPGKGHSSPIVWGDYVFVTAAKNKGAERYVVCVRAGDGKLLWSQLASRGVGTGERLHSWNTYASSSCTTDGKYVFAFFGTPGLFCYDYSGKLVWKHSFGIFTSAAGWGTGASPVLFDDLVIVNCDNDGPAGLPAGRKADEAAPMALVALEKATGKVRWTTRRDQGRGFSTPRLMTMPDGRVDLVLNGPLGVWGYDPATGKERWRCPRTDPRDQARFGEPLPVDDGKMMFISSGRPGPCQGIKLPGSGDVTKTHVVWTGQRRGHRDVSSPILWEGRVYAADKDGRLSCIDLKTGKELYSERLSTKAKSLASPIAVRGKLLFLLDNGETVVVEPGDTFKVAGRNRLGSGELLEFGASPAVADGRLFLRSQTHLYCVGEKK